MKKVMFLGAVCAAMVFAGCAPKKTVLYIYNWDAYLEPGIKAAFERQYNCRIQEDIFDSNEMLEAKIKAGGSAYDVLVPSSYEVERLARDGLIMPLNYDLIPNATNVDPAVISKLPGTGTTYAVPYMMSYTGIAYLKSKVANFEPSWRQFERTDLSRRMTLLNDFREVLGSALKTLGYSANTTNEVEIRAAAELVLSWKANIAKFENEQYKNGIASGEFLLVQGYVGDLMQVQLGDEETTGNEDIEIVIPNEGTTLAIDMLVIPSNSRNPELAHAFINFLHAPENAAQNTEFVYYLCPNVPSYELIDEEVRANPCIFPSAEIIERSELLQDVGPITMVFEAYWEQIKSKDKLN